MERRDVLPVHPRPNGQRQPDGGSGALRLSGLIAQPGTLSAADLNTLPRVRLAEPFVCEEGWSVDGLVWEGIPLREIVARHRPLPEARYLRVYAGDYWLALSLADLEDALLCDRLNDAPLTPEHGAPWRLVLSGGACFTSVKWVEHLELAAEPGDATAERLARRRIAPNGNNGNNGD
ncbi:MAG TPA: molybdopterin-dependent oxidoreductase [Ktedonobacterales bacterium]|nr:molybdopterin-dependent oxidoreductase [Ktedonobacterales bacterium]